MAELEGQQVTTGLPGGPAQHGDANGIGVFSAPPAETPGDPDDERPVGGISVISIPKREIARLEGTLRLGELPRRKPTIVFDAKRSSRDADDE
jgi:hypothetical protein